MHNGSRSRAEILALLRALLADVEAGQVVGIMYTTLPVKGISRGESHE